MFGALEAVLAGVAATVVAYHWHLWLVGVEPRGEGTVAYGALGWRGLLGRKKEVVTMAGRPVVNLNEGEFGGEGMGEAKVMEEGRVLGGEDRDSMALPVGEGGVRLRGLAGGEEVRGGEHAVEERTTEEGSAGVQVGETAVDTTKVAAAGAV